MRLVQHSRSDPRTKQTTTNEPGSEAVSGEATDDVVTLENQPTSSSVVEEHVGKSSGYMYSCGLHSCSRLAATDSTDKSTIGCGSASLSSGVPRAAWRGNKPLSIARLPANTKRYTVLWKYGIDALFSQRWLKYGSPFRLTSRVSRR